MFIFKNVRLIVKQLMNNKLHNIYIYILTLTHTCTYCKLGQIIYCTGTNRSNTSLVHLVAFANNRHIIPIVAISVQLRNYFCLAETIFLPDRNYFCLTETVSPLDFCLQHGRNSSLSVRKPTLHYFEQSILP